jgi:hypothetical protein
MPNGVLAPIPAALTSTCPEDAACFMACHTGRPGRVLRDSGKEIVEAGVDRINHAIIPALCAKAAVPAYDGRGNITSHLARCDHVALTLRFPPLTEPCDRLAAAARHPALWSRDQVTHAVLGRVWAI